MFRLLLCLALSTTSLFAQQRQPEAVKLRYVNLDTDTVQLQGPVTVHSMQSVYLQASANFSNDLHLFINSPGGDMRAAEWLVNQFDLLRARGKRIKCYAGNQVASAAFFIYLHCDERYAIPQSRLFPHKIHIWFSEPVLPEVLISTGLEAAMEQERWDQLGREITGMSELDYKAFRDSDNSQWSVIKVQQKSTKKWFVLVDHYFMRVGR